MRNGGFDSKGSKLNVDIIQKIPSDITVKLRNEKH